MIFFFRFSIFVNCVSNIESKYFGSVRFLLIRFDFLFRFFNGHDCCTADGWLLLCCCLRLAAAVLLSRLLLLPLLWTAALLKTRVVGAEEEEEKRRGRRAEEESMRSELKGEKIW